MCCRRLVFASPSFVNSLIYFGLLFLVAAEELLQHVFRLLLLLCNWNVYHRSVTSGTWGRGGFSGSKLLFAYGHCWSPANGVISYNHSFREIEYPSSRSGHVCRTCQSVTHDLSLFDIYTHLPVGMSRTFGALVRCSKLLSHHSSRVSQTTVARWSRL